MGVWSFPNKSILETIHETPACVKGITIEYYIFNMHFYIDLHVFNFKKEIKNKHYITLDNSLRLLYTVIKKRRKDIKNENYNQYFPNGSHI